MFREVIPGSASRLTTVDHTETYGRHILTKVAKNLNIIEKCVDLGCGNGDDLAEVKKHHPNSELIGIDFGSWNSELLIRKGIIPINLNIENQSFPFEKETVDLMIANQVLEHTKEIYWINHEIFRTLKIGGHLYLGVPNILSLHNRILGLFGIHPTSAKIISAHVRVFSKSDTFLFYQEIANDFTKISGFYGSQFYPFPREVSRFFSSLFPSLAFSIFFLIRKTSRYNDEFIKWPSSAHLATNFFCGHDS